MQRVDTKLEPILPRLEPEDAALRLGVRVDELGPVRRIQRHRERVHAAGFVARDNQRNRQLHPRRDRVGHGFATCVSRGGEARRPGPRALRFAQVDPPPRRRGGSLPIPGVMGGDHRLCRSVERDPACIQQQRSVAEPPHRVGVVAHEEDRPPLVRGVAHLAEALPLKGRVAHRENLVHDQDVRFQVGGHGEGQPQVHAARIVLHGSVDEAFDLGEGDDFVELAADLLPRHPQDRTVEVDVLAPGELPVEARPHFEQRPHPAADPRLPFRGFGDAGKDLEERALSRAVASDDAEDFAAADFEGDVAQRPDYIGIVRHAPAAHEPPHRRSEAAPPFDQRLPQVALMSLQSTDVEALAHPFRLNHHVPIHAQTMSAKVRSTRRK